MLFKPKIEKAKGKITDENSNLSGQAHILRNPLFVLQAIFAMLYNVPKYWIIAIIRLAMI
jgi:hypothetical protein